MMMLNVKDDDDDDDDDESLVISYISSSCFICTGLIDAGETAEQAAVRELKEETGYTGAVIQHISARTYRA